MFSMFFGAGNIVFPLAVGLAAGGYNHYAMIGLTISAVLVPFLGLISMTVFDGKYRHFFARIGTVPGMLLAAAILALVGPFGAIPRCITLAYATLALFVPNTSLIWFSIISCIIIFLCAYRRSRLLDLLGYVLTPLLLVSLIIIVTLGIANAPGIPIPTLSPPEAFQLGLVNGYQTMDLLGAFFFSSVVMACLHHELDPNQTRPYHQLVILALKASILGAGLLILFYVGFSYVAGYNATSLAGTAPQALLGMLALHTLGPFGGIVACVAAALACLTTAVALSAVFAQFLNQDICRETINYPTSLAITLAISFLVSTLDFHGIAAVLTPILHICYPGLIVLALVNLLYKLTGFAPVKTPVYLAFILSLIVYLTS